MGKRELLLVAVFVVVGAVAYRVTAPTDASGDGFSLSRFLNTIRSEIRGQNVERQTTRTASADAKGMTTLRVLQARGTITITGEDRQDVTVELKATVFGMDEAQAREFEQALTLDLEADGTSLDVRLAPRLPEMRRQPRVQLTVRVPSRLQLEIGTVRGELEIVKVAGVTFERGSGKTSVRGVTGPVSGEFESGELEMDDIESIQLETRRAEVRLSNISGQCTLEAEGGELRLRNLRGPVELSLRRIDTEIENVAGPLKVEGEGGQLRVRGPGGPVTINTERMGVEMTMTTAVAVDATTTGDTLEVALPPQGVRIEAVATHGQIRAFDPTIEVTEEEDVRRATATVRGGGPLIKLETTRGDLVIR